MEEQSNKKYAIVGLPRHQKEDLYIGIKAESFGTEEIAKIENILKHHFNVIVIGLGEFDNLSEDKATLLIQQEPSKERKFVGHLTHVKGNVAFSLTELLERKPELRQEVHVLSKLAVPMEPYIAPLIEEREKFVQNQNKLRAKYHARQNRLKL